jgi:hypothetical protein
MAFFGVEDGKRKDAAPSSGLYTTDYDDSTRTFYLTINNVTDDYNRRTIKCQVVHKHNNHPNTEPYKCTM